MAKTTDQSDLWWIPGESGWGIQFVQQENTIFATMFVYGPDGSPIWYTATLNRVGLLSWSGGLYATTGPWFVTVPFDLAAVTVTPVGSMNLNAPLVNRATLVYTVNGVTVTKTIQRQNLVTLNFNGDYSGVLSQTGTGAACNPAANTNATPARVQITQTPSAVTAIAETGGDRCTLAGRFGQGGHFGLVEGVYTCASGDSGTFQFFEMAISYYELRARTQLTSNSGCTSRGYFAGLVQPPPAAVAPSREVPASRHADSFPIVCPHCREVHASTDREAR